MPLGGSGSGGEYQVVGKSADDGAGSIADTRRGYRKLLSSKRPDWRAEVIGDKVYQVTMAILGDLGNDTKGRKINSRGTTEAEYGSLTGIDGAEWQSMSANG